MEVNPSSRRPRLPMLRTPVITQGQGQQSPALQGFSGCHAGAATDGRRVAGRMAGMIRGICGFCLAAVRQGGFAMQRKGQEE